jgi:selenocysteine-specific elongation factor
MDPDRLAEEKRRGLTIDLGFAWTTLPSGREIGFVDVPGHERFVRNMLAGVGPVRLVLFVVAADEGWKPQSEEHLGILDVLGVEGAVVALTKRDLVDHQTAELAQEEVRERLVGTALERAPIVPCSSLTREGVDDVRDALDRMVAGAPKVAAGRIRQHIDRVFPIRGAGTVVTGTLTGGPLEVGQEVEIHPTGRRARIRGLQTHKRAIRIARPVSRVATNLVGVDREQLERGDVLSPPQQWRPTALFEARIRPIRGLDHSLTPRGAYKLYAGSAEREASIRFYERSKAPSPDGGRADVPVYARVRVSAPLVLDVHDRFVLREAGRRATVAGGVVLDVDPPTRPGVNPGRRLAAREAAGRDDLPALAVRERGAVRAHDLFVLTGAAPSRIDGAVRAGPWWISDDLHARAERAVRGALEEFHGRNPLLEGAPLFVPREALTGELERSGRRADPGLVDGILEALAEAGIVARDGPEIRLASHRVELEERREDMDRLVAAVASAEPTPPTVRELEAAGFDREVVDAAGRGGLLVRIGPEIVVTPGFVDRAEGVIREQPGGITVSAFRERLGTSRKYALPLLEWFDQRGLTRRVGDVRLLRDRR